MKYTLLACGLLAAGSAWAGLPGTLKVSPKGALNFQGNSEKIVYEGKQTNLSVGSLKELDKENLYVFPINTFLDIKGSLEQVSKVHHYEEGDFAVVEPLGDNEKALAEVAHQLTGACGALFQLNQFSEVSNQFAGDPSPMIEVKNRLEGVTALHTQVKPSNIKTTVNYLEAMGTRYHTSESGKQVPTRLADKYKALIPADRTDVSVTVVDVERSPQDNLVVRIEGSEKPDEVIVLGSHIDSITSRNSDAKAPGADDDASGTAINMEIFRVLMENGIKPKRTVEIHGYAAEEIGLVGSADLAKKYKRARKNVVSMVQFDLALYSDRRGSVDTMFFVKNGTNAALNRDLIAMAEGYQSVKTVVKRLTAGTSDHQSWMRNGFPASFPTENPTAFNRKIHTLDDRLSSLHENSVEFAAQYARLGLSYVVHYAGK